MFFALSKILWFLADPGNLLLILLAVGMLMLWTPWRRGGRRLVTLSILVLIVLTVFPFGKVALQGLENRIPPPKELPEQVGGIIVLGGMIDQFVSAARGTPSIGAAGERLTEFAALARRYPDAQLVFTGGSGNFADQSVKEADQVKPFLHDLGMDIEHVTFESDSRNTHENAVFTKRMVQPIPEEPWILITSAFHMPRSLGSFRQAGWTNVIPYPVDYATPGNLDLDPTFDLLSGLGNASVALHEWLGLTFYYLTGRTNAFYPGSDS